MGEVIASISYLRKNSQSGPRWFVFTIAWRLICSSFALGALSLFVVIGNATRLRLRVFMLAEIILWCIFLAQEWKFLAKEFLKRHDSEEAGDKQKDSNNALD